METKTLETKKISPLVWYIIAMVASIIAMLTAAVIRYNIIDSLSFKVTIMPYVSLFLIFGLCYAVLFLMQKGKKGKDYTPRTFGAISVVITITYTASIFLEKLSPYAMPLTLTVMVISLFVDTKVAFFANVISMLMIFATIMSMSIAQSVSPPEWVLVLLVFSITAGTIISITITRDTKRLTFIWVCALINLISIPLIILNEYIAPSEMHLFYSALPYALFSIVGSVVLALLIQPIIEAIFNVNSNFRLIELCDHHRPLLLRLAKNAPGTFNHSLTVANLAETCARAIGENTYFARAAAYYHDVGKLKNTRYFKENQFSEANPHDGLTPEVSTDIIRKHAIHGLEICKEYRIPPEIAIITAEHHGTMPIQYFYSEAKKLTDRELDIKDYSYYGPIPSSKIAAIIMICDAAEATIRANNSHSYNEVLNIVKELIDVRLKLGQFDNCDITLKELAIIRDTIVEAFGGLYHERIKYPSGI